MPTLSSLSHFSDAHRRARFAAEMRALWRLAWPVLVGQLATVGMAVVDVAMAGHASAQDLAGVSLGVSVWNMFIITMMGIMMSVSPTVAHQVGAGDLDGVPHIVRQGLWKALGIGLLACLLANWTAQVFDHMTLEPRVRALAQDFHPDHQSSHAAVCLLPGAVRLQHQHQPDQATDGDCPDLPADQHCGQQPACVWHTGFSTPGRRRLRLGHPDYRGF
jgi:hypothetical protein